MEIGTTKRVTHRQLGQLRPANTTAAAIFSPTENKPYHVHAVLIANTGSSTIKVSLFHDTDGDTWDETTAIVWEAAIATDGYLHLTFERGITGYHSAGSLGVKTDTADDATFTVYGHIEGERL